MALLLGAASLFAGVGGSALSSRGQRRAGKLGQQAKEYEAQTYERQAKNVVGAAQVDMLNERRNKELIASRATALAAAGGGGVHDTTVQNIISDINSEGAYREAVALYRGEDEARKLTEAARLSRMEGATIRKGGQAQSRATVIQGAGNALGGASSLYGKYGARTGLQAGTGTN